jgi:hypothetical protein
MNPSHAFVSRLDIRSNVDRPRKNSFRVVIVGIVRLQLLVSNPPTGAQNAIKCCGQERRMLQIGTLRVVVNYIRWLHEAKNTDDFSTPVLGIFS